MCSLGQIEQADPRVLRSLQCVDLTRAADSIAVDASGIASWRYKLADLSTALLVQF